MEAMARQLYQSVQTAKALPDYLQIWPGHGAGSPCGKTLGDIPSSTLGYERLVNWAFRRRPRTRSSPRCSSGQPEPPKYFGRMKVVNREGPTPRVDPRASRGCRPTEITNAMDGARSRRRPLDSRVCRRPHGEHDQHSDRHIVPQLARIARRSGPAHHFLVGRMISRLGRALRGAALVGMDASSAGAVPTSLSTGSRRDVA